MTRIEQYLTHAIELDALSDSEKCAICAAMEGEWPWVQYDGDVYPDTAWCYSCDSHGQYGLRYELDSAAALRLVDRFKLCIVYSKMAGVWMVYRSGDLDNDCEEQGMTVAPAVVACVCALALERWNG